MQYQEYDMHKRRMVSQLELSFLLFRSIQEKAICADARRCFLCDIRYVRGRIRSKCCNSSGGAFETKMSVS